MLASEEPTVELTLVAPGSFVRALLRRMTAPRPPHSFTGQEPPANGKTGANGDKPANPQIVVESLPSGTLQGVPHLVGRFPLTPALALDQADSLPDEAAPDGPDVVAYVGVQAVGAELLHAILCVANGEGTGEPPDVDEEPPSAPRDEALLSPRELEVLELLIRCASNREIAAALSISMNTVKTHVRHIMSKLKTNNRARTALVGSKLLQENSSLILK